MDPYFNPRSREGSDPGRVFLCKLSRNFNPRSREGSDRTSKSRVYLQQYFNPRSREGSDEQKARIKSLELISIHAPVKGATYNQTRFRSD